MAENGKPLSVKIKTPVSIFLIVLMSGWQLKGQDTLALDKLIQIALKHNLGMKEEKYFHGGTRRVSAKATASN